MVALLAILIGIAGAILVIVGILLAIGFGIIGGFIAGPGGLLVGVALGAAVVIAGAILLIAALGLWGMQSWAWWLSIVVVGWELVGALSSEGLWGKVLLGGLLVYLLAVRRHFNQ